MKLQAGQVAVVTGAASGIGFALAEAFAAKGLRIVLADVEAAALAQAEATLREKGAETLCVTVDVAEASQVESLAEGAYQAFGAVHVVCNNAGVSGDFRPVWEQSLEAWEWVLGVNLWGVIHGVRSFIPRMLEAGAAGHIVNTASIAGVVSMPLGSPYHVSKHGVVTLSESLAHELREQEAAIGVSVLCPGYVRTQIADAARNRPEELQVDDLSKKEERWVDSMRRVLARGTPPEEVAACVTAGVAEDRFYVFSHPEWLEAAEARFQAILKQEAPVWSIPKRALEAR